MPVNYTIFYKNLPNRIFGFTVYCGEDDYYTIIINSRHSYLEQQKTFKHELQHIINGDFFSKKNIDFIENYLQ